MAAAAFTGQAIFRPNLKSCFLMQHSCKLNLSSVWQVPVSNHAECNPPETLARPLIFTSPSRAKFSVYASRNSDIKTSDDELNLEENSDDVNNLEEKREMQRKKSELEELGEGFVGSVKPLIRVLNGSTSFMPARKSSLKSFLNTFVRTMSGSAWTASSKAEFGKRFREVEADFLKFTSFIEKFLAIMLANGAILAIAFRISDGNSQLDTLIWSSWFAVVFGGTMIWANQVLEYRCKSGPQNVVITGSTRGLGKALAREFIFSGDHVVIASRSPDSVRTTVAQLQQELNEGIAISSTRTPETQKRKGKVFGISCDVSNAEDVKKLAEFAVSKLGSIDIWINNAGTNKGFRPLMQFTDEDINQIVSTNLIGSLICTREAIRLMKSQEKGGHIFNMDGAGSGGSSTPLTAVYGATKCGLRQLHASLLKECKRSKVGIHTASPGMVLTDLLLSGASLQNKKMFNIICELPETVARSLVPRMRTVKGTGKAVDYLTPPRILLALITAWLRRDRWFDEKASLQSGNEI
ncbi:probable chlorophyll(ide) b reductase NYC1, chloroplastic isoform X2 [Cryptomeria japonica]|uniref:probable chlorophyll(ide) b reductase NYC1, chloroplastic isoform X2 n=1 Tax=Cryptomeria japonica TaxID=3369 RepID=UPI0027DA24B1|nr:probable chlorophyll(ide) b reductase NYC1, chloroplastic isoform X2 [Cryptomeria japonica]